MTHPSQEVIALKRARKFITEECGKPADPAKEKYWCAWCGVWGDHQSGWCKDLKAKLGDTPNELNEPRREKALTETNESYPA